MIARRSILLVCGFLAFILAGTARAETLPLVTVYKDPSCDCCAAWADHVKAAGFSIEVVEQKDMRAFKRRNGVPQSLSSCHTAKVGGYIVEGHVPVSSIVRMLREKPAVKGLAVPGMPLGSPGMEVEGVEPETYNVILFDEEKAHIFAQYRGETLIGTPSVDKK